MASISTADLSGLLSPPRLRRLFQSLAMLDAIMSPEWDYRYYSYDAKWGEGETMGSMRNGSGDEFFALFDANGCYIKGFGHEHWLSDVASTEFYKSVPDAFASGVSEPAFDPDHVTFCCWCYENADKWEYARVERYIGREPSFDGDPDGSGYLLGDLNGDPKEYLAIVEDYYEQQAPPSSISAIYDHRPLTQELISSLNPEVVLADVQADADSIGYPSSQAR